MAAGPAVAPDAGLGVCHRLRVEAGVRMAGAENRRRTAQNMLIIATDCSNFFRNQINYWIEK